jgi:hypothetical protein
VDSTTSNESYADGRKPPETTSATPKQSWMSKPTMLDCCRALETRALVGDVSADETIGSSAGRRTWRASGKLAQSQKLDDAYRYIRALGRQVRQR